LKLSAITNATGGFTDTAGFHGQIFMFLQGNSMYRWFRQLKKLPPDHVIENLKYEMWALRWDL
jgi:hypothetical protein